MPRKRRNPDPPLDWDKVREQTRAYRASHPLPPGVVRFIVTEWRGRPAVLDILTRCLYPCAWRRQAKHLAYLLNRDDTLA